MATSSQTFGPQPTPPPPHPAPDPRYELWPLPGTPEPNLHGTGLTEARRVFEFWHGETTDQRLDALKHLANICMLKANRRALAYWQPRPYLKFVDAKTWRKDWENCDPSHPVLKKIATRGWFITSLPEHISKYSPDHVTRRELLELTRIRDANLLHVCNALLFNMLDESAKQATKDLHCTSIWSFGGQDFYFDKNIDTGVQLTSSATMEAEFNPDYAGAVEMLVKDKRLRAALPPRVCRTLELVFRKLDAGISAKGIIREVARDIKRDQRTVRRHLRTARRIATDVAHASNRLLRILESFVIPDERSPSLNLSTPSTEDT
jgi:hypothetical protein